MTDVIRYGAIQATGYSPQAVSGGTAAPVEAYGLRLANLDRLGSYEERRAFSPERGANDGDLIASDSTLFAEWFDRFHVLTETLPLQRFRLDLELGNVLSFQERPGILWNAYDDRQVIVSAVNVNAPGVTLSGLSLPEVIAPLSVRTFLLSIDTTGAPVISGTIDFVTSEGTVSVQVTGRRVVELPLTPQFPMVEALRFSTQITKSRNGAEQRNARRSAPQQVLNLTFRDGDENVRELQNLLFEWQARLFGVRMFHEARLVGGALLAGATSIPVDTSSADYRAGGLASVRTADGRTREIVEVREVLAESLTLESPLVNAFPLGSNVAPARLALTESRAPGSMFPINAGDVQLQMTVTDNQVIEEVPFDDTFEGLPIFSEPNTIGQAGTYPVALERDYVRTSFDGVPRNEERSSQSIVVQSKGWRVETQEELWKVRSWLHQLRGSRGVFRLSTFRRDFELLADIGAASVTIDVVNRGFSLYVGAREPFGAVEIVLGDGTTFRRLVDSSVTVTDDLERVGITTSLGVTVQRENVERISLLQLCRIAGDRAQIEHDGNGGALVTVAVQAVRQ